MSRKATTPIRCYTTDCFYSKLRRLDSRILKQSMYKRKINILMNFSYSTLIYWYKQLVEICLKTMMNTKIKFRGQEVKIRITKEFFKD